MPKEVDDYRKNTSGVIKHKRSVSKRIGFTPLELAFIDEITRIDMGKPASFREAYKRVKDTTRNRFSKNIGKILSSTRHLGKSSSVFLHL